MKIISMIAPIQITELNALAAQMLLQQREHLRLPLLSLGTGINTGEVTVGLMGRDLT